MEQMTVTGPVFPVVTPFKAAAGGRIPIDYEALGGYVTYLLDGGARNIMVASATSRFAQLDEEEIRSVNDAVVQAVGECGLAIASTGILGSTDVHVETVRRAEQSGARAVICEYPWRFQSEEALVGHFAALVESTKTVSLLVHVTPGRSELGGLYRYSADALEKICDLPRVIGMKEACGDPEIARSIWGRLAGRTSIIVAGRAAETYAKAWSSGVSGFFTGTGNIVPGPTMEIDALMRDGKEKQARQLIDRQETPFLTKAKQFGWHASLKAALHEMGLMELTERPPMVPLPAAQRAELAAVMKSCGWLD